MNIFLKKKKQYIYIYIYGERNKWYDSSYINFIVAIKPAHTISITSLANLNIFIWLSMIGFFFFFNIKDNNNNNNISRT